MTQIMKHFYSRTATIAIENIEDFIIIVINLLQSKTAHYF